MTPHDATAKPAPHAAVSTPATMPAAQPKAAARTAAKPSGSPLKANRQAVKKPVPKAASKVRPPTAPKSQAQGKAHKVNAKPEKRVTEEFKLPQSELKALKALKARAVKLVPATKKSTLLRAAIQALGSLSDAALRTALQAVPAKIRRPS